MGDAARVHGPGGGIGRRRVLAGLGSLACLGVAGSCAGLVTGHPFICLTSEGPPARARDFPGRTAAEREAIGRAVARFGLSTRGTGYFRERWRTGDGNTPETGVITLGVHVDNATAAEKATVERLASDWLRGDLGRHIRFDFSVPRSRAQIRVMVNAGSNSSEVGRRNLDVPAGQATMKLAAAEARAIRHEFGHALGLRHEHHHPASGIIWRERVVIDYMRRHAGWSEQMTRSEILDRYGQDAACIGDPRFDRNSVMLYPIPREWTENFSSDTNVTISARDRRCLEAVYSA